MRLFRMAEHDAVAFVFVEHIRFRGHSSSPRRSSKDHRNTAVSGTITSSALLSAIVRYPSAGYAIAGGTMPSANSSFLSQTIREGELCPMNETTSFRLR